MVSAVVRKMLGAIVVVLSVVGLSGMVNESSPASSNKPPVIGAESENTPTGSLPGTWGWD
jgi:hypothetical protein